jgi:hypothetical protein
MKFLAAALLATCLASSVQAAEIALHHPLDGSNVITISGFIEPSDDLKFNAVADSVTGLATVVLNSNGGWNAAAGKIGLYVHFHKWHTRVRNGSVCNSACTLIWVAGVKRKLDGNARLGFHSVYDVWRQRSEDGNKKIAVYLKMMGAPQQLIDLQPIVDPCCLNFIDRDQALQWRLLDPVSGPVAAPAKPNEQPPAKPRSMEGPPLRVRNLILKDGEKPSVGSVAPALFDIFSPPTYPVVQ